MRIKIYLGVLRTWQVASKFSRIGLLSSMKTMSFWMPLGKGISLICSSTPLGEHLTTRMDFLPFPSLSMFGGSVDSKSISAPCCFANRNGLVLKNESKDDLKK